MFDITFLTARGRLERSTESPSPTGGATGSRRIRYMRENAMMFSGSAMSHLSRCKQYTPMLINAYFRVRQTSSASPAEPGVSPRTSTTNGFLFFGIVYLT